MEGGCYFCTPPFGLIKWPRIYLQRVTSYTIEMETQIAVQRKAKPFQMRTKHVWQVLFTNTLWFSFSSPLWLPSTSSLCNVLFGKLLSSSKFEHFRCSGLVQHFLCQRLLKLGLETLSIGNPHYIGRPAPPPKYISKHV